MNFISFDYQILVILTSVNFSLCNRRMNGPYVAADKGYVVYLLNFENHHQIHTGALISTKHVLTLEKYLSTYRQIYVIAGYRKFVSLHEIDEDNCTKIRKQKIIEKIIPATKASHMSHVLGIGVVEKPYDFSDRTYRVDCSYTPSSILINRNKFYESPGMDVVAYGWGTRNAMITQWDVGELLDYVSPYLRVARVSILKSEDDDCKGNDTAHVQSRHLICVNNSGVLDSLGQIHNSPYNLYVKNVKINDNNGTFNNTGDGKSPNSDEIIPDTSNFQGGSSLCQNDEGAPLVNWMGKSEILIGIGQSFAVANDSKTCVPPFYFIGMSMAYNTIKCMIAEEPELDDMCDKNDFKIITVDW